MILEYLTNGAKCYEESNSISFMTVPINKGENITDIIAKIQEDISDVFGIPMFEIREKRIIDSDSKAVKIAILNDNDRSKSKVFLFNQSTTLYLLNNSGKTIGKK